MNLFRPLALFISVQFLMLAACQNGKVESKDASVAIDSVRVDSAAADSDALVLALTPTVGSLPLYYAKEAGIFKTLGLKVKLKTYNSQFDCDTAMLGSAAIGGSSDLLRLHYQAQKGNVMSAVSMLEDRWSLVVSGSLRIKRTKLLTDRMIAVARFSSSDFFSEQALDGAGMEYEAAFRPQINDYYLRAAMLKNHQVDAAVLPEPFVTQAKLSGHNVLFTSPDTAMHLGCLAFKPSLLEVKDSAAIVRSIVEGYNSAVKELNAKGKPTCVGILKKDFRMSRDVIDALVLPVYQKAKLPSENDIIKCQNFLKDRERWMNNSNFNLILNKDIIPG